MHGCCGRSVGASAVDTIADPPERVDAEFIRGLRLHGEPPCEKQLSKALHWIGERSVPFTDAFKWAESAGLDVCWVKEALGITGYGYGDGSGYGYGPSSGYGSGSGDGSGYGSSSSSGYGYGYGYGYGDGYGYGYGSADES